MRLNSIKLAGFKSFVDPTLVPFPGGLTAVVGPNGCGKSNIIDAIRWVMGESSAKQLRGESLDDVIFNGSSARKPLGQASIELHFDNLEGKLGGQYSNFSEILIRREITRDGQSSYYLNGTRCRRRDIIDIFLGTGLGPRSYAIIEQGMISRLIEAKPDDMRSYLEETAGISKYKERRHETELRISHTQENLSRLNDLRDELGKQLDHLQKQANAAERYKVLKQEERLLKAQLLALRWQVLENERQHQTKKVAESEGQLSGQLTQQQGLEATLSEKRLQQQALATQHQTLQEQVYQCASEVARLEQMLAHYHEKQAHFQNEQQELAAQKLSFDAQLEEIEKRSQDLEQEEKHFDPVLLNLQTQAEQARATLQTAEQDLKTGQIELERLNREEASIAQTIQVEKTKRQHYAEHIDRIKQRLSDLARERETCVVQLDLIGEEKDAVLLEQIAEERVQVERASELVSTSLVQWRQKLNEDQEKWDAAKYHQQTIKGKQASLAALQQEALGQKEQSVVRWLTDQGFSEKARLAQILQVEPGWESAVETVLGFWLQTICVDSLSSLQSRFETFPEGDLAFVEQSGSSVVAKPGTLLSKVRECFGFAAQLEKVSVVENLEEAFSRLSSLQEGESLITREGAWLSRHWFLANRQKEVKSGILQRERELHELELALSVANQEVEVFANHFKATQEKIVSLEKEREALQEKVTDIKAKEARVLAEFQIKETKLEQQRLNLQRLESEAHALTQQQMQEEANIHSVETNTERLQEQFAQHQGQLQQLQEKKQWWVTALEAAKQNLAQITEAVNEAQLKQQKMSLQRETATQSKQWIRAQLQQLQQKTDQIKQLLHENETPFESWVQKLAVLKQEKEVKEKALFELTTHSQVFQETLELLEKQRAGIEEKVSQCRNELEQLRLNAQSFEVRAQGLTEQLQESGQVLEEVLKTLTEVMNEAEMEAQVSQTARKIERLGAINLAAVEEYQVQQERKNYLDSQYQDLMTALETLREAIQKMDKETRAKFKETFDAVNQHFQSLFPLLFGGGCASLTLQGDDWLNAGVSIMAQPPGKRNSTIHLLSGGEKALTAVALVFSFFHLNPAPFCLLDEVDAPLDDANVGRFCKLVTEMSEKVQFIFISHNKLAIEMANHLIGVTMREPGVSRLVSVDVEEAIALATA